MVDLELLRSLYKKDESELKDLLDVSPKLVRPVVTQLDASNKKIKRYFVRPANDLSSVIEIDKLQYDAFKSNFRFIVINVDWRIVGNKKTTYLNNNITVYGVEDLNRIAIADADLTFGGLRKYITNYLEFWFSES
jgi:hypothetical protein